MKTVIHLTEKEICEAIAEYAIKRKGVADGEYKVPVNLTITPNYDFADRSTGTSTVTATATFEERTPND